MKAIHSFRSSQNAAVAIALAPTRDPWRSLRLQAVFITALLMLIFAPMAMSQTLPVECLITGNAPTCSSLTNVYLAPEAPNGDILSYQWTVTGNAVISGADNDVAVTVVASGCSGEFTLGLVITSACCSTSCSTTYSWTDNIPPVIGPAGPDGTVHCPDNLSGGMFTPPTATDNCDMTPTIIQVVDEIIPGDCPGTYTQVCAWIAVDDCGNESEQVSQTISVVDITPPVLSQAGPNLTIHCPEVPTGSMFTPPTATDACDPNPQVILIADEIIPGDCPQEYTWICTWIAVDACGNESAPVSQSITVIDTTPPVLSAPGPNLTVSCTETPTGSMFTPPTATDACDPNPQVVLISDDIIPGDCPQEYVWMCTWIAIDACGNQSAPVSQSITVVDEAAPVIGEAGPDMTVTCDGPLPFTPPTATDNCDPDPEVIVVSETSTAGCPYQVTRVWVAVDACGNQSGTVSQTLTVIDDTPPVLGLPGPDLTISCPEVPVGAMFTAPVAVDACDPNPEVILIVDAIIPGDCPQEYAMICTWIAVDACGNQSEPVTQTVTVVDVVPPFVSVFQGNDTVIICPELPMFTPPVFADNCDPELVQVVQTALDSLLNLDGTMTITASWIGVDGCGNGSAEISQSITVVLCDQSTPTIADDVLVGAFPNPVADITTIQFTTGQTASVTVDIYDILGVKIANIYNGDVPSGVEQRVEFDASGLAAGNYMYVVTVNGKQYRDKLIVKRR